MIHWFGGVIPVDTGVILHINVVVVRMLRQNVPVKRRGATRMRYEEIVGESTAGSR